MLIPVRLNANRSTNSISSSVRTHSSIRDQRSIEMRLPERKVGDHSADSSRKSFPATQPNRPPIHPRTQRTNRWSIYTNRRITWRPTSNRRGNRPTRCYCRRSRNDLGRMRSTISETREALRISNQQLSPLRIRWHKVAAATVWVPPKRATVFDVPVELTLWSLPCDTVHVYLCEMFIWSTPRKLRSFLELFEDVNGESRSSSIPFYGSLFALYCSSFLSIHSPVLSIDLHSPSIVLRRSSMENLNRPLFTFYHPTSSYIVLHRSTSLSIESDSLIAQWPATMKFISSEFGARPGQCSRAYRNGRRTLMCLGNKLRKQNWENKIEKKQIANTNLAFFMNGTVDGRQRGKVPGSWVRECCIGSLSVA